MNLYQYCGNNPVNYIDPYGENIFGGFVSWIAGSGWNNDVDMGMNEARQLGGAAWEGAKDGAQIVVNEYSFGATDALGWTNASEKVSEYGAAGEWSQFFAGVSRDAAMAVAGLRGGAKFGGTKVGHVFNNNRYLRIGPGNIPKGKPYTLGPGQNVPTLRIGNGKPSALNHLDLRMRIPGIGKF